MPWDQSYAKQLIPYAGLAVMGDIGDLTVWTNKNWRIIVAPRSPPDKPPSGAQQRQRARFGLAQQNWRNETAAVKANWELLANRLSLCATGQNVYISLSLLPDDEKLATANRRGQLNLAPPPVIPP